ncbi:MAG: hypothetical protein ACYDH9_26690 [Limisphaerales bacterium]
MKQHLFFIGAMLCSHMVANAEVILNDAFSYPDGPLVGGSGSPWVHHSGSVTGEVNVASGCVFLSQKRGEDVNAALAGAPYSVTNPATLYARFTVNFTALPTKAGTYFAHFKDASTGFRARLFAGTNNAAPGCLRLSIANAATDPTLAAPVPTDLSLNTDYAVVIRYEVATGSSALWLNPGSEADPAVLASDAATTNSVTSFAFRQSLSSGSGMGELSVDNLLVGTAFADVVPQMSPPTQCSLTAAWLGGALQLTLAGEAGRTYAIEASDDLVNWTFLDTVTDPSGSMVFTEGPAEGFGARFYRARLLTE